MSALALLLERHRPGMRAVTVSLLGPGADVDDVMQEAALVALRRIVDVRDPETVGPAGRSLFVREMELINPPDKTDRCPPGGAWITTPDGGRSERVSLHHAPGRGLNPHLSPTAPPP